MSAERVEGESWPWPWKYTPGHWVRRDGARAERITVGSRAGIWIAKLPGTRKYIQVEDPQGLTEYWTAKGFRTARGAKAALDEAYADDKAALGQALRALTGDRP